MSETTPWIKVLQITKWYRKINKTWFEWNSSINDSFANHIKLKFLFHNTRCWIELIDYHCGFRRKVFRNSSTCWSESRTHDVRSLHHKFDCTSEYVTIDWCNWSKIPIHLHWRHYVWNWRCVSRCVETVRKKVHWCSILSDG